MKKVYIASPFFNDEQNKRVDFVEETLASVPERVTDSGQCAYSYFSPRNGGFQNEHETLLGRKAIYHTDIKFLERAELVVAVLDDNDPGTIYEVGYAVAKGIPVILVHFEQLEGLNLMLSQSCYGLCSDVFLHNMLIDFRDGAMEPMNDSWELANERQDGN